MTREMYDAVTPANIPVTAQMVAGYLAPSRYTWTAANWARFPDAVKVRIAVRSSTNDGHVLDVETGDATPAQAPVWARMRRASGYAYPTIYCSVSVQSQVIDAFNQAGEPLPLWWLAHYDNIDALPAGAIAKQYADPGPVDRSIVADFWPGVDTGVPEMELTDTVPVPNLDSNGNYTGDGPAAPVSDLLRFSDASVRWLVEKWVPSVTAGLGALAAQLNEIQAAIGTPATELTGFANVTVNLAPKS